MSTLTEEHRANLERHARALARAIAVRYVARIKARRAEYEAEVDEWYRAGDGRAPNWRTEVTPDGTDVYQWNAGGMGHRFPSCIHGRSLWVDHDIPCGTCEDESGRSIYELALTWAWQDAREYQRRASVFNAAFEANAPSHIAGALVAWATDALPDVHRNHTRIVRNLP